MKALQDMLISILGGGTVFIAGTAAVYGQTVTPAVAVAIGPQTGLTVELGLLVSVGVFLFSVGGAFAMFRLLSGKVEKHEVLLAQQVVQLAALQIRADYNAGEIAAQKAIDAVQLIDTAASKAHAIDVSKHQPAGATVSPQRCREDMDALAALIGQQVENAMLKVLAKNGYGKSE